MNKNTQIDKTGIYRITNKVNGKSYVGQAVNIGIRWQKHISDSKNVKRPSYEYPICRALRKYDIENFEFVILEECSIESLNDREIFWIAELDSFFNGYNQTMGGNQCIKVPKENIIGTLQDLKSSTLSIRDIALKRGLSVDAVYDMNAGISWKHNVEYPIRKRHGRFYYDIQEQCTYDLHRKELKTLCPCCGGRKHRSAKICNKCRNAAQSKNVPSKDVMIKLLLEYTFVQIGEMYNVSDNAVRKWCQKYNLPSKSKDVKTFREKHNL